MLDAASQSELKRFTEHWKTYLAAAPELALDSTWPSVGVIDALTFPLRRKAKLNKFESTLVRGCAVYLATMAHHCWKAFGVDGAVELRAEGVVLVASGGELLGSSECVAYIERDLTDLLRELPAPLPLFSTFERLIPDTDNFVSPFAFALFVGLLPTIEGPWSKETPQSWSANIISVLKIIAASCAESYARLFPDEQLGQLPELYYSELIYPLTMMSEELPLRHAVHGILGFIEQYKVSTSAALKLCRNLSRMADERISDTGFAFTAALSDSADSPELRAFASTRGVGMGLIRRAMVDAREKLANETDWLDKTEYTDGDSQQIEKEIQLRFFPWVKMSTEKVLTAADDEEFRKLLKALGDFNLRTSNMIIDALIDLAPDDMEFRLQKIYMELIGGDLKQAEESLKRLLSEPLSEDKPLIYDLMGTVQIFKKDLTSAEFYIKRARSLGANKPKVKADLANNYAWLLMLKGDFENALEMCNECLSLSPDALMGLLNKTTTLHQLHRYEEAAVVDRRLMKLAPMNREVFRGLVYDAAASSAK